MKIGFDSSVLVASMVKSHPEHIAAADAIRQVLSRSAHGYVSTHAMAETWAVLTRLPVVPRIHPLEARQMLARNIADGFTVVALTAADYDDAIRICAEAGWSGGRVYDALHIIAARRSECDVLYTLNVRHFRDLAPDLNIRTP